MSSGQVRVSREAAGRATLMSAVTDSEKLLSLLAIIEKDSGTVSRMVRSIRDELKAGAGERENVARLAGCYMLISLLETMTAVCDALQKQAADPGEAEKEAAYRILSELLPGFSGKN